MYKKETKPLFLISIESDPFGFESRFIKRRPNGYPLMTKLRDEYVIG